MKRFIALVVATLFVLNAARADGPDDQYVQIYGLIQEGDTLNESLQSSQALAKYVEAQAALQRFQKGFPDWNSGVIKFRLQYLATRIATLSAIVPAPAAAAVPPPAKPLTPQPPGGQSQPEKPALPVEVQNQISILKEQVRQLQSDNSLLEAKLKEALAAQPAGLDPAAMAKVQEQVKASQKEVDALKIALALEKAKPVMVDTNALTQTRQALVEANRKFTDQSDQLSRLTLEKESLQKQLKEQNDGDAKLITALRAEISLHNEQMAKLTLEKETLQKENKASGGIDPKTIVTLRAENSLQNDQVKKLAQEKEALQKQVNDLSGGNVEITSLRAENNLLKTQLLDLKTATPSVAKPVPSKTKELENQLAALRAKLAVLEAKPVPYRPEELALLERPPAGLAEASAPRKPSRALSPATVQLVADAQRFFSSKQFEKAEAKYQEVLKEDQNSALALANLAMIQIELGRLSDAEKNIKRALAVMPDDAYNLSVLGHLRFLQRKYDEALDALSQAAKLDPQSAEIQNYLGITLSQKGMRIPAETALRKAIELQPGFADAHHNLAVVYATQKPPALALAKWHYQRALAVGHPRSPELEKLLDETKTAEK